MAETITLAQSAKIRLELEIVGKTATFRPIGTVDEDINFSVVLTSLEQLGPDNYEFRFDLGRIDRINSCGVREWLLLMERLPATTRYTFANVNELMIEQANMISGILGRKGTPVTTFQAPYRCDHCKTDVPVMLEPKHIKVEDDSPVAPPVNCPTCAKPLTFDWLEDEYFAFIKRL